ncbi:hypothetical protein MBLNU230_g3524t1 [Neophaeotheca triangularis]
MSSGQKYSNVSGIIDPEQVCEDVFPDLISNEWYAPISYVSNETYLTPIPSSTFESQPWQSYTPTPIPNINFWPQDPTFGGPNRPRSSPSTFGPSQETMQWTMPDALGIQYTTTGGQPTPATSTFPTPSFQPNTTTIQDSPAKPQETHYTTPSPPSLHQPQPQTQHKYPILAPNPSQKRKSPHPEPPSTRPTSQQPNPKATTPNPSATGPHKRACTPSEPKTDTTPLSPDDRFLVQLKEAEQLPWKAIATRFRTERGRVLQVAALQMRYKRLRERYRVWRQRDVEALRRAHEFWHRGRWEIVSGKMIDFGLSERWPARLCAKKWAELEASAAVAMAATNAGAGAASGMVPQCQFPSSSSAASSSGPLAVPGRGGVQFAFVPLG